MATPPTADQLVAALKAEGLTVIEYKSWRTHNRNSKGAWGPIHGVMLHHTASSGEIGSVDLCYSGYSGLPGPLCQAVIAKSGRVYMTGHGRCNHAGGGDPDVLQAVIDERYSDRPPIPKVGNASGIDGNARFIGAECINLGDGKDPWTPAQVDAMVRWSAAICRLMRWSAKSVIAHREWSKDKPDPAGPGLPTMPQMRAKIAERLAHPPSWSPPTAGTPDMAPAQTLLSRTTDMTLVENVTQTIYWENEHQDEANEHGAGGKTVADNVKYSAVLNLAITGLGLNESIEVAAAEEDGNGDLLGESEMIHRIWGVAEGFHPMNESVPFVGRAANRLVFRLRSRASGDVKIGEAWLSMHTWPLS
jgi:N-acetylmuramoyl-L-alanine amidase-like protein